MPHANGMVQRQPAHELCFGGDARPAAVNARHLAQVFLHRPRDVDRIHRGAAQRTREEIPLDLRESEQQVCAREQDVIAAVDVFERPVDYALCGFTQFACRDFKVVGVHGSPPFRGRPQQKPSRCTQPVNHRRSPSCSGLSTCANRPPTTSRTPSRPRSRPTGSMTNVFDIPRPRTIRMNPMSTAAIRGSACRTFEAMWRIECGCVISIYKSKLRARAVRLIGLAITQERASLLADVLLAGIAGSAPDLRLTCCRWSPPSTRCLEHWSPSAAFQTTRN